jgi:hypothetical protein
MKKILALIIFGAMLVIPAVSGAPVAPNENSPAYLTAWAANQLANMEQPVYSERLGEYIYVPESLKAGPGNSEAQAFLKWLEALALENGIDDFDVRGISPVALVFHYPVRDADNPVLPALPPNNPHLVPLGLP